jgi:hypothetical protein
MTRHRLGAPKDESAPAETESWRFHKPGNPEIHDEEYLIDGFIPLYNAIIADLARLLDLNAR